MHMTLAPTVEIEMEMGTLAQGPFATAKRRWL